MDALGQLMLIAAYRPFVDSGRRIQRLMSQAIVGWSGHSR
jgi:hypothetical protein